MDSDVLDLSGGGGKKTGPTPVSNLSRGSSGRGRRDLVSPDPQRLDMSLPFGFNQFMPNSNVIPQVQVPHDLTRLVSMLRERDRDELSCSPLATNNRNSSSVSSTNLSSILLPQMNPNIGNKISSNSRKQSGNHNLKRRRHNEQDSDNFSLPQSQYAASTGNSVRRSLRPRAERSYAESPDIVVDYEDEPPAKINGIATTNGNGHCVDGGDSSDSNSDYGEMPPSPIIKELSVEEVEEREKLLEALREQVRNEETKLVLLKKLRQSQMMKENVCITQSNNNSLANSVVPQSMVPNNHMSLPNMPGLNMSSGGKGRSSPKLSVAGNHLGSGLSISQGTGSRHLQSSPNKLISSSSSSKVPSLLKGQPTPSRISSSNQSPIANLMMPPQRNSSNSVPHNLLMAQQSLLRGSRGNLPQTAANMILNYGSNPPGAIPPPTISPAVDKYDRPKEAHSGSNSSTQQAERRHRLATTNEEERETPAQRQAAAKLALRKQLEKTLLQIPPPKPPPPEMNFIPNPSNMEFLALIGLEFVVDYIIKDHNISSPTTEAVTCSQCETDFSSMWKFEKGKIICEQCATSNAKKSLKAEHTNRLKTAFVQALQQEQEIEQRLAQGGSLSETLGTVNPSTGRNDSTPSPSHTPTDRERQSPQVTSERTGRNRTPTQSPGLGPVPLTFPIRDREREQKDREREAQREIEKAMAAAISSVSVHPSHRERESNRDRSSSNRMTPNESLNLSAHSQHSFTQQLRHEMAQLAQLHEQQYQQQQLQMTKHSSRGKSNSNSMNSRSEKREKDRDSFRSDRGADPSSLLSMTFGQSMANQLLSQNIQNLTMGQAGNSSGSHKSSQSQSSNRRSRNVEQSHKQSNNSKQQKLDADAAAKFASALGISGSSSSGSGVNPTAVAAAAALQAAAHQQLLRLPPNQQLPAHLLQFSPLLYPYQMAMAQASGKQVTPASLAELQRQQNETLQQLQRQYLLDMIPNSRNMPQNWKT